VHTAPRRPPSGSGLSLSIPSEHAVLYDPGEIATGWFQSCGSDLGLRHVMSGSALPTILLSASRRADFSELHWFAFATACHEEEELTYKKVRSARFGLIQNVALDDQVDTQPLVVPHVDIPAGPSPGVHNVVYVATEGNTIYAIDASNGQILLNPNFGYPVPLPLGCSNNAPNVGINGTPVIDRETHAMYVIIYSLESGTPVYRIHSLDLSTLTDKVSPVVVSASHKLSNNTMFPFSARYQRQRPALLLSKGNVYAGFGSFCDFAANVSRGWLLGWNENTLSPLAANQLDDTEASSPNSFFLSSIWMSGYGLAADQKAISISSPVIQITAERHTTE
jgi:hypothetical protein